ncbi:hypothetical protein BT69DRAFT_504202 [Atractiella rhizophila]|nr:hypothetical protein BT69DRAFT_504202 [Atractiella rhizophila]
MSKKVVRVGIIDDEQVEYDVHLFERASTLGMDANSHTITAPSGAPFRVDSPMRAMQGGTHDRVFKLYEYLGIPLTQKNFDYSFFIANSRSSSSRLVYEGSNGFGTFPPFKLNPSSSVWEYISISIAYVLLVVFSFGLRVLPKGSTKIDDWELGDLEKVPFVRGRFLEEILVPLFACVCTADVGKIKQLPLRCVTDYIADTFLTPHFVTTNGVQDVVSNLLSSFPESHIHLKEAGTVINISSSLSSSSLPSLHVTTASKEMYTFDYLVFALPAHQSLRLLGGYSKGLESNGDEKKLDSERLAALGRFEWATSLVIDHRDWRAVLPPKKDEWRDLNIALSTQNDPPPNIDDNCQPVFKSKSIMPANHVMATHILSRTHQALAEGMKSTRDLVLQTTNPTVEIEADKIIKTSWYERALVTRRSAAALEGFLIPPSSAGSKTNPSKPRIRQLLLFLLRVLFFPFFAAPRQKDRQQEGRFQGVGGIYLCGSWCGGGIPLLDGCVTSAEMVVEGIWRRDHGNTAAPRPPWEEKTMKSAD